ncbi:MAG: FIST C-terminal domain-containing protein [Phycisphaerae bacterium]|nr:FIST C-terminal domain-containing protein [Phycisphaerae bacterium]
MRIATAVVTDARCPEIGHTLAQQASAALDGQQVDLCVLFASAHFEDQFDRIADDVHERLLPQASIGATSDGIIHGEMEYEHEPAVALWVARLPGCSLRSFHVSEEDIAGFDAPNSLRDYIGVPADEGPHFVLLGDPLTCGAGTLRLLDQIAMAYPRPMALGGMASAGERPGQNQLLFDGHVLRSGLVGVAVWGDLQLDMVVSQGCRPIGGHMVITKAERNVIHELGGRKPLAALTEILRGCRPRDFELVRKSHGLLVGRAVNEAESDFLIRNPIDIDYATGALAINDLVRVGQTVQFHVRDAESAAEELAAMLSTGRHGPSAGALLFSCNGRGTRLFSDRHHDARAVAEECGRLPVAGMFCAGEIGPVGTRNFLHGQTACIGFFRPA